MAIPGRLDRDTQKIVERMRSNAWERDLAIERVRKVRRGEFADVWPDQFSEKYPTSIVANFVDVAARDLASNLSPLPSLACSAGNMKTNADKKRAEKMNRIGFNFWRLSRLQTQMKYGADQYLTYGFLPFWVEADYERKTPIIHVEDPNGAYYELDRWLKTKRYCRTWTQDVGELAALFPEYATQILYNEYGQEYSSHDTDVVRYIDDQRVILYLPQRSNMIVAEYYHNLGFAPVHVALRPGVELEPRGQFDDVLWVQLAATVMAALTLEAGHKSVQAPLAVPSDMNQLSLGPDALLVTDNPDKIKRVELNVPAAAFALGQELKQEMHEGAGYPDTRLGAGPAGGSTGRGISALEGGFDSQIRLGQDILGEALRLVTEMCFRVDKLMWPKTSKTATGTLSGESFELTYTPGKDIADNVTCDISYGFAAGLSPNSAIVTLLQLRGDGIISRNQFRRQLPFDIDVEFTEREMDIQTIEDGLKQGLAAALTATGQMIAQGQVEQASQFFTAAVSIIQGRRKGDDLADLFVAAFQPPPPPPEAAGPPGAPGAPGATGPDGEPLPGVGANGLPSGTAPGQAGLPPGGRPSIMDLTAGFTGSGAPNLNAGIRRRIATG